MNLRHERSEVALSKEIKRQILGMFKEYTDRGRSLRFETILKGAVKKIDAPEREVLQFLHKLEKDHMIFPPDTVNDDFFQLTEEGETYAKELELGISQVPFDLEAVVIHEDLLQDVMPSFEAERYGTAIFEALKHIEKKLRAKIDADAELLGTKLVDKAFSPDKGCLTHPLCETGGERQGIHQLFRGGVQLMKSPEDHRDFGWDDRRVAGQAIVFADLLLGLLEQAEPRREHT
ncbi:TIGR02391 family protein [candidate division TA06 bacterium]|uniref:TIGR02391 family protein n=1 Tax=candidate division TA06 bacterium TaxID=2250710 RepID=A0A523UR82_UNCT6|nr:MAG: TIGR02391 family protein [candidate division TA06 bacterium]